MDKYAERLTGFMRAVGCMNDAANRVSDYFVVKLNKSDSILTSLARYHSSITNKFPAAYWHPQLEECSQKIVMETVKRWFFEHEDMQLLPSTLKENILANFLDDLNEMTGNALFYSLNTSPPVWYGSLHEEFVIESQYGRYLIHFSCH
ncbi:TPA: hypothetical protein L3F15_004936 [Enterobacter cloacae]|uniref:hypothetical protein n=1 Tax=Enterobacter cloacae TaxID=550 RepID=UPI0020035A90|nr:hypothetical protein [Enterobacter cloacae]MCK6720881.1 hypothetical protein [Enterobacter cloacae]HBN5340456.1 hypothetical protein [Enterobacter cloacae]HBN5340828.1 hypothetical protein [Enterobacter cloacae]